MGKIDKKAVIEAIDAVLMDNPMFISHLGRKKLYDQINALPTYNDEVVKMIQDLKLSHDKFDITNIHDFLTPLLQTIKDKP
jgi:hypothetical protein